MSSVQQRIIFTLLGLSLIAFCTWGWFQLMEKKWAASRHISTAAQENPMLAATRLLNQHQHTVQTETLFSELLRKPISSGTLILAENNGIVTPVQAQQILVWVRQGNTLITRPKWESGKDNNSTEKNKRSTDTTNGDPIGTYLGTVVGPLKTPQVEPHEVNAETETLPNTSVQKNPVRLASFKMPDANYPLQIQASFYGLQTLQGGRSVFVSDDSGVAVRIYPEGKGRIVMLATNYFDNYSLRRHDHAELLLQLTALNPVSPYVVIVQHTDIPKWYRALWFNFQAGIISVMCLLLLLLWRAIRRFGPVLPEPDHERRSLLEHIDASGRWLWKIPGGRDLLLTAVRTSTNKILQRRAPELQRLSNEQQIIQLAQRCNLLPAALISALQQPASKTPIYFTQQIQTLQLLRKYYER